MATEGGEDTRTQDPPPAEEDRELEAKIEAFVQAGQARAGGKSGQAKGAEKGKRLVASMAGQVSAGKAGLGKVAMHGWLSSRQGCLGGG